MLSHLSLHIGLNAVDPFQYSGWRGHLQACENDAESMADLAMQQGFKSKTLLTAQATKKNVVKEINHVATSLVEGGFFFLTYSGHGGKVDDTNRDELDGINFDQTWCLYDQQLIDDDIRLLLSKFKKGVRIFLLSDSCHSGSMFELRNELKAEKAALMLDAPLHLFKQPEVSLDKEKKKLESAIPLLLSNDMLPLKIIPSSIEISLPKKKSNDTAKANPSNRIKAGLISISACNEFQSATDGTFFSIFTGAFLYTWKSGLFNGNYKSLHKKIVSNIHSGFNQTPIYRTSGDVKQFEKQTIFRN